jgi:hypothetical protein
MVSPPSMLVRPQTVMINESAVHYAHEGSPIPYLLVGIAAMLALIGVSLLILACSYWKFVGYNGILLAPQQPQQQQQQQQQLQQLPHRHLHLHRHHHRPQEHHLQLSSIHTNDALDRDDRDDAEASSLKKNRALDPCPPDQVSCRLVVIMAGHHIPTFLAQPIALKEDQSPPSDPGI